MLAQGGAEVTLSWPTVAGGVASVTVIIGAVIAVVAWAYRRLVARIAQDVGVPAQQAADQLAMGNGRTVANHVASASADLAQLKVIALRNQETSLAALALAQESGVRLDRHIVTGHRERREEGL